MIGLKGTQLTESGGDGLAKFDHRPLGVQTTFIVLAVGLVLAFGAEQLEMQGRNARAVVAVLGYDDGHPFVKLLDPTKVLERLGRLASPSMKPGQVVMAPGQVTPKTRVDRLRGVQLLADLQTAIEHRAAPRPFDQPR